MNSRGAFFSMITEFEEELGVVLTTTKLSLEVLGESVVCDMNGLLLNTSHLLGDYMYSSTNIRTSWASNSSSPTRCPMESILPFEGLTSKNLFSGLEIMRNVNRRIQIPAIQSAEYKLH